MKAIDSEKQCQWRRMNGSLIAVDRMVKWVQKGIILLVGLELLDNSFRNSSV